MKQFRITYSNSLILFGGNVFTVTLEGRTAHEALANYAISRNMAGMLQLISAEEVAA